LESIDVREPWSILVRFAIYGAVILGVLASLTGIARRFGFDAFRENDLIETIQLGIVTLTGTALLIGGWRLQRWRQMLVMMAALVFVAAIRESDHTLDAILPLGWKGPALLVLAAGIFVVARDIHAFGRQIERFIPTAAFGMLWAAMIFVIGCAQLIGHGPLMQAIVGPENYSAALKRAMEESLELAGYLVLAIGCIETLFTLRRLDRLSSPKPA
jgi:hypothetical protein